VDCPSKRCARSGGKISYRFLVRYRHCGRAAGCSAAFFRGGAKREAAEFAVCCVPTASRNQPLSFSTRPPASRNVEICCHNISYHNSGSDIPSLDCAGVLASQSGGRFRVESEPRLGAFCDHFLRRILNRRNVYDWRDDGLRIDSRRGLPGGSGTPPSVT
jgi:hypothetical protein